MPGRDAALPDCGSTPSAGYETWRDRMSAALDVRDLRKQFSIGRPAVDGVSFHVAAGEIVVLLGPSGCGKTTTLRCVAGLEHRDRPGASASARGVVSAPADGVQVPPRARNIGMVFQSYAVWPHMTVRQNVAYPLRHRRVPRAEIDRKVGEILELVGLSEFAARSVVSALRRADAARRARAQPGLWAATAAARRAAQQSRRPAALAAARRPAPDHQADRRDSSLCYSRPGGGRGAGRPHRRHARRQAFADGRADRALQSPRRPVRRQFHRCLEPARWPRARAERRVRYDRSRRPTPHGTDAGERQGGRSRQGRGAAGERSPGV